KRVRLRAVHLPAAEPLAEGRRGRLRGGHPCAAGVPDAELQGLPRGRQRVPQGRRRAAQAGARRVRDPPPRLRRRPAAQGPAPRPQYLAGQPGPQHRRVLRLGAGEARGGALPVAGGAPRRRPRAQPLRSGAGLLPRRATAPALAGTARGGRLMMRLLIAILSIAGLGLLGFSVQAVEVLRWERLPLVVPLVVGEERVIFLDHPVKVGYERALAGKLRVQSASGAVYLRADEVIEPTRLHLQRVDTG